MKNHKALQLDEKVRWDWKIVKSTLNHREILVKMSHQGVDVEVDN